MPSVQRVAIRPPAAVSRRTATFAAAVDHRHVAASPDDRVAARNDDEPPIRWPSPGALFASAPVSVERRALDADVMPGIWRSVVAPGPGALHTVLRHPDVTSVAADRATRRNGPTRAATTTAARPTDSAFPARQRRVRPAPTFAPGSSHRDDQPAQRGGGVSDVASRKSAIGRTPAPSRENIAAQFLAELSHGERRQPRPLPASYHPMAEAITGHHRVLISTDDASRRALRAVNKVAATTGAVIHLAAPPAVGHQHTEVMAHELTHVAHPSPAPRFFADDHRGPEERRADEIARVIARSPLAPTASIGRRVTASTAARSAAGDTSFDGVLDGVIRRSPDSSPARSAGTTVAAAALAEQIMRGGTPSSNPTPTIRRFDNMPPLPPIPPPSNATSRPPTAPPVDTSPGSKAFWEQVDSTDEGAAWFRNQLQANFDRIVRLLEHHMIGELERRGGRSWKGY